MKQQEHQFVTGETRVNNDSCHANCSFRPRHAKGDREKPFYLISESPYAAESRLKRIWRGIIRLVGTIFPKA